LIKENLLVVPDRDVNLPGGCQLGHTPMFQVVGDQPVGAAVDSDHPRVRGQRGGRSPRRATDAEPGCEAAASASAPRWHTCWTLRQRLIR